MRSDSPYEGSLDHIVLDMTSQLELGSVLASIADGLVRDFAVALARVWLLEPGEDTLRLRASAGLSSRLNGAYAAVPIGARKIGQIAERGAPVVTNDLANDPRIADPAWAEENGLVSFAGWPLTFRGALLGVLAIFSREVMTDERKAPMELFVHQAAIAIKNARLFAEVTALEERLRAENAYLRREVAGGDNDALALLSRCDGLGPVLLQVRQVGPTSTTVLIQGETGTGKELVARALHEISPRSAGPLVKVNCAALSPALVESELFGHEKGAFTGAQQQRTGRFELANGGTLFLDEIGELPLELQPKLLRVLQEGELDRVGGSRPVKVNARIVSATNRDLRKAVDEGRFRADLFYRLAVFAIDVSPLRERPRDLEGLAQTFLQAAGHRLGKRFDGLAPAALRKLLAHDWPGNVRELSNVIERAAIVARGPVATEDDLPPLARRDGSPERPAGGHATLAASPGLEGPGDDAELDAVERWHIERVLRKTGYVIEGKAGTAAILGLAPSTLRSRMAQLRIRRPPA